LKHLQPDGRPATLSFITVGGRTSAFIEELQLLPEGVVYKPPKKKVAVSDRPWRLAHRPFAKTFSLRLIEIGKR